jgi:hypothetical protein
LLHWGLLEGGRARGRGTGDAIRVYTWIYCFM